MFLCAGVVGREGKQWAAGREAVGGCGAGVCALLGMPLVDLHGHKGVRKERRGQGRRLVASLLYRALRRPHDPVEGVVWQGVWIAEPQGLCARVACMHARRLG